MRSAAVILALSASAFGAGSCATAPQGGNHMPLVGTEWRLDHFQSSDDAIGTIRPGQDEVYTLLLSADGSAAFRLACNRATGRWTSPDPSASRGSLQLEPGAMTMAACTPGRLDRFADDIANVRSFVIADGRLNLNLMADAGNYVMLPSS